MHVENYQLLGFPQLYVPGEVSARPGDKLRVKHDLYDHVGTLGYDGLIYAASFKFRRVTKATFVQFSGGKQILNEGHVGPLPVSEVINRYEAMIDNPYDLLFSNCEHTDNWARGFGWNSEQVNNVIVGAAIGAVIGFVALALARR